MHTKFFSTIFMIFYFGVAATAQDPRGDDLTPDTRICNPKLMQVLFFCHHTAPPVLNM